MKLSAEGSKKKATRKVYCGNLALVVEGNRTGGFKFLGRRNGAFRNRLNLLVKCGNIGTGSSFYEVNIGIKNWA